MITGMLLREVDRTGRVSFVGFYSGRVRRILPALALTTTVVAVLSIGVVSESARGVTGGTGIAASFFVSNLFLAGRASGYFDPSPVLNPFLHLWSLSVEEQFYFVFPAGLMLLIAAARRRRLHDRAVLVISMAAAAVFSFAISLVTTGHGSGAVDSGAQFAFYMAPARAWEFAVGGLLAAAAVPLARVARPRAAILGYVGAAVVVGGAVGLDGSTPYPGTAALIPVVGTAFMIMAGTAKSRGVPTLLGLRPFTRIGDISYSWYLWHWPMIVFAAALWPGSALAKLMGAGGSLIPALCSYRWLERPIHTDLRWRGRRAVGLAAVCVAVPVASCLALLNSPLPSANAATRALLRASHLRHADHVRRCDLGVPIGQQAGRCTWRVPHAHGTIALVGDSNAGQFTEPIVRAAARLGYDVSVATYPNCPLVEVLVHTPIYTPTSCRSFVDRSVAELVASPPDLVVLGSATPVYLEDGSVTLRDMATGAEAHTPDLKTALWTDGLRRVLRHLHRAGVPVLLIHAVPQWLDWHAGACAVVEVYFSPQSCGTTQSAQTANQFRRRALLAERRAVRTVPGAATVDFFAQLCPTGTCATNRGDRWDYHDGRHLSVVGSIALTSRFVTELRAALGRASR